MKIEKRIVEKKKEITEVDDGGIFSVDRIGIENKTFIKVADTPDENGCKPYIARAIDLSNGHMWAFDDHIIVSDYRTMFDIHTDDCVLTTIGDLNEGDAFIITNTSDIVEKYLKLDKYTDYNGIEYNAIDLVTGKLVTLDDRISIAKYDIVLNIDRSDQTLSLLAYQYMTYGGVENGM